MKNKFCKWMLVVTLFFVFVVQQGYSESGILTIKESSENALQGVSMEQVKRIFPEAHSVQMTEVSEYLIFNREQQKIGRVLLTSPVADNIVGFSGPVPLLIGVDLKKNIIGVLLLENRETAEYVVRVENSGLLSQWGGLSGKEALKKQVDVVSGATLTSKAVIQSFQKRVSLDVQSNSGAALLWIVLLGGVVLLGTFYYFFKQKKKGV